MRVLFVLSFVCIFIASNGFAKNRKPAASECLFTVTRENVLNAKSNLAEEKSEWANKICSELSESLVEKCELGVAKNMLARSCSASVEYDFSDESKPPLKSPPQFEVLERVEGVGSTTEASVTDLEKNLSLLSGKMSARIMDFIKTCTDLGGIPLTNIETKSSEHSQFNAKSKHYVSLGEIKTKARCMASLAKPRALVGEFIVRYKKVVSQ